MILASSCAMNRIIPGQMWQSVINLAEGALLEVSEDGAHDIGYCLMLCAWLRQVLPHCRLMLMCSESRMEDVHRAIEAKQRGEIDDFVFYDASLDYLVACLQAL